MYSKLILTTDNSSILYILPCQFSCVNIYFSDDVIFTVNEDNNKKDWREGHRVNFESVKDGVR